MRILDRYIFREVLIPMLIGLLALTFVFLSRQIGHLLEVIIRQAATASELAEVMTAILPKVLTFTLPMAVLVGILTGFGRMSSDNEAIAFRAAGISMWRIMRPVLFLACGAWLVNLGLTVWIAPKTAGRLRALEKEIALKQVALEVQPRVFNESLPNFDLYVRERRGLEWRGIMLSDKSDPDNPRVIFAESGVLVQDEANRAFQLTLSNGNRHMVSPAAPRNYDFSTFEKTTIPIPMTAAARPPARPAVEETSTRAMWERIQAGSAVYEERIEFHSRIALPFACLALALVGLP